MGRMRVRGGRGFDFFFCWWITHLGIEGWALIFVYAYIYLCIYIFAYVMGDRQAWEEMRTYFADKVG